MPQVIIDNQKITLTDADILGVGGEATVYGYQDKAIKLYLDLTPDRGAKLNDIFKKKLPANIVAPLSPVFDNGGATLGFAMQKLDNSYIKLSKLAIKSYRQTSGLTLKDIALQFDNGLKTIKELHKSNILIGDLNKFGVFFNKNEQYFIDADSFQFDHWPCVAYTTDYLDPLIDPTQLKYTTASDYYAFLALFLQSSLMVHPYSGGSARYASRDAKFRAGVTVFDPTVIYPISVALSPEFLTDELLDLYMRWYSKTRERSALSDTLFSDYANSLVLCPHCNETYPKQRKSCPTCRTVQPVQTVVAPNVKTLIQVGDGILSFCVDGNDVYVLAKEGKSLYEYNEKSRLLIGKFASNQQYSFNQNNLWVYNYTDATLSDGVTTTTTDLFDGDPVFGVGGKYLYKLSGNGILRGEYHNGDYRETLIKTCLHNQTWFEVAAGGNVYGFIRSKDLYSHFLIVGDANFDAEIPNFKQGEVLLESRSIFTSRGVLVVSKTKYKNAERIHLNELDLSGKLIQPTVVVNWPDVDLLTLAYAPNSVFRPTNNGVVRYKISDGTEVTFNNTVDIVSEGDKLALYKNGILVIKNNRVLYVE